VEERDVEWIQHVEAPNKGQRGAFWFVEIGVCGTLADSGE